MAPAKDCFFRSRSCRITKYSWLQCSQETSSLDTSDLALDICIPGLDHVPAPPADHAPVDVGDHFHKVVAEDAEREKDLSEKIAEA
jgi:hypothetical protein